MERKAQSTNITELYLRNFEEYKKENTSHLHRVQLAALESIYLALKSGEKKIYVEMPTGTGKSIIISALTHALSCQNQFPFPIYIVTSRLNLINQLIATIKKDRNEINPGVINGNTNDKTRVIVTTYNAFRDGKLDLETESNAIYIFDEVHNLHGIKGCGSSSNVSGIQIGFTATPDYAEHKKLVDIGWKNCFQLSVENAILQGLISPFDVIKINIGFYKNDYPERKINGNDIDVINSDLRHNAIALLYEKYFNGKKVVIKAATIQKANQIKTMLSNYGLIAEVIHNQLEVDEKNKVLDSFRQGTTNILIGVKIISEGFDIPDIEGVIFDGTPDSAVETIQFAGRALRVDPNNPDKRAKIIHVDSPTKKATPLSYFNIVGINIKQENKILNLPVPSALYGHKCYGTLTEYTPLNFDTNFQRPYLNYEFVDVQRYFSEIITQFGIPFNILLEELSLFIAEKDFYKYVKTYSDTSTYHKYICGKFTEHLRSMTTPDPNLMTLEEVANSLGRNNNRLRYIKIPELRNNPEFLQFIVYKFDKKWAKTEFFKRDVLEYLRGYKKAESKDGNESWLSADDLEEKYGIYVKKIPDLDNIKHEHPEWFTEFSNNLGQNYLYYSVKFAKFYRERYPLQSEADRSHWFTLVDIEKGKYNSGGKKIKREKFKKIAHQLIDKDQKKAELIKSFRAKNGDQVFYYIDLINEVTRILFEE
jgi:superfamily II DNA or RNA helicase